MRKLNLYFKKLKPFIISESAKRNKIWYLIAAFFSIFMLNTPLTIKFNFSFNGGAWYESLLSTWEMAMNYFYSKHLLFGKDIVFTYGPLAFLSTRNSVGVPLWVFVCFDLFVVFNYFFVFKDYILLAANKTLAILTVFSITIMINSSTGVDTPLILLFFIYYWFFKSYNNTKFIYFIPLIILLILSFYIKQNTFIVGFIFFIIHLMHLYIKKKINIVEELKIIITFSFFFIISLQILHTSVYDYVKNSFDIVKGYNEVMRSGGNMIALEYCIIVLLCSILFLFIWQIIDFIWRKNYSMIFFPLISCSYLYIVYKQAITRGDTCHIPDFFFCAPLILLGGHLLYINVKLKKLIQLISLILVIATIFHINDYRPAYLAFADRYSTIGNYVKAICEYTDINFYDQKDKRMLPQHVLDKIGSHSIDVFPWNSEYLTENNLNYTPRPIFQSYSAYTEHLEQLNYNFYINKPPEFVLYKYDAIDGRYAFNEECLVNLFLVQNYVAVDTVTSNEHWWLLLQKKEKTNPLVFHKIKDEKVAISKDIEVTDFSFLKIHINNNLHGKLLSFLYRPNQVNIQYQNQNGKWFTFKTSTELLKTGLYVHNLINDNIDFLDLLSSLNTRIPIKRIKLIVDSESFLPKMKVEYFNIENIVYKDYKIKPFIMEDTNLLKLSYNNFTPKSNINFNGAEVFALLTNDTFTSNVTLPKGIYKITIKSCGSPLNGIYAHVNFYVGANMIGNYITEKEYQLTDYYFEQKQDGNLPIRIQMDNDAYNGETHEDRNAYIQNIFINKVTTEQ